MDAGIPRAARGQARQGLTKDAASVVKVDEGVSSPALKMKSLLKAQQGAVEPRTGPAYHHTAFHRATPASAAISAVPDILGVRGCLYLPSPYNPPILGVKLKTFG